MKNIYERYCNGDPLSDKEVLEGELFYRKLSEDLYDAGIAFHITAKEANRIYLGLRDYRISRGLPKL